MADFKLEKRSDWHANNQRIKLALIELWKSEGIVPTIPQIAAKTGFGETTIRRHFDTAMQEVPEMLSRSRVFADEIGMKIAEQASQGNKDAQKLFLEYVVGMANLQKKQEEQANNIQDLANEQADFLSSLSRNGYTVAEDAEFSGIAEPMDSATGS